MPRWISTLSPPSSRIRIYLPAGGTRSPARRSAAAARPGGNGQRRSGRCTARARDRAALQPRLQAAHHGFDLGEFRHGRPAGYRAPHHERQPTPSGTRPSISASARCRSRRKSRHGARGVRQRGAALRPDERPDVAGHPPDLEARSSSPPWSRGPDARLLDLAGGTGDITFGWLGRGGGPAILSDINAAMLAVGRDRALNRGFAARPQPSWWPTPSACRCRTAAWTASSIAFGLRNCTDKTRCCARRGACCGRAGGSCAWSSAACRWRRWRRSTTPGRSRCCRGWAASSPRDADSYQYLAESIRMFPDQETLAGDDARRPGCRGSPCATCPAASRRSTRVAAVSRDLAGKRVLLIVSGGIAAFKALELIRLLRARGLRACTCVLTAGRRAVRHPAVAAGADRGQGLHRPVLADRRERDGPHPAVARRRSGGGGAGHRRTSWRRWRPGWPTTWPPPCCWRPTSRCWWRRR